MVKNYILWLIFIVLLTVTSATACLAGQDSDKKQNTLCFLQSEEDLNKNKLEDLKNNKNSKESKDEDVQESSTSILYSNFIFYIIYKFKFVDDKSNQFKYENDSKVTIPILSYTRSIYVAIISLFEKKY
ncbi:MAG: hypothetical protein M3421_00785 [Bacteroidota bacterium]|nr:hypothetical protein [Bacteroidota bacterium]